MVVAAEVGGRQKAVAVQAQADRRTRLEPFLLGTLGDYDAEPRTAAGRVDIPRLMELYTQGQYNLDDLVTNTYTLDQINEGYDAMRKGENIRGVILFD